MKIRNETETKLVFIFGDRNKEEPEAMITLKVGEDLDLDSSPTSDISIKSI